MATLNSARPAHLRRRCLLQGASVVAFVTALGVHPASAQLAALRGAGHVAVSASGAPTIAVPVVPGLSTGSTAATSAAARMLANAGKAQQSVNMALQAQTAAKTAAAALAGSVPNGLAIGGLQVVANPVAAANDATGLNTWQNVNLPTQTVAANGATTVNVKQTSANAIASWTTFNVGANTTLNFDQSLNGVAQPSWVVLNRVVGQIDPTTGLRNPNLAPAPSQILGKITAQGTVLVINQNGIIFSPTAQINTNSLIATSLEIGTQTKNGPTFNAISTTVATTITDRDNTFLQYGLLETGFSTSPVTTFSGQEVTAYDYTSSGTLASAPVTSFDPLVEGSIVVDPGAQITSGSGGYVILAAPTITNSGVLTSPQGQVSLASGQLVYLSPSTGAPFSSSSTNNPDVRGLVVYSQDEPSFSTDFVENTATGLIQAPDGYVSLQATNSVINAGTITASTSVSRNGFISLSADNINLTPNSVIVITPDDNGTIPQDPTSLANFQPSQINIGFIDNNPSDIGKGTYGLVGASSIDIQSNSLIYAPSANIYIGASPGTLTAPVGSSPTPNVFIDSGAIIDASGLKNVQVPASTLEVTISPVTTNDTADTPTARSVLDHQTVTVDTRLSGVSADGVAWVGTPLLSAAAYAQQVGVSASQLMTKGGAVVIGGGPVVVKPGATIDISGGWETFAAGQITTTELITATGAIVPIGDADPNVTYVGIYNGYTETQSRFGISTTYANPLLAGSYYEPAYSQGADAGSLTFNTPSQPVLQGAIYASAFTGPLQAADAVVGTAKSTVYGDQRNLQAAGSQLPVGGFLFFQQTSGASTLEGDGVETLNGPTPTTASNLIYSQPVSVSSSGQLTVASPAAGLGAAQSTPASGPLILSASALSDMNLGQLSIYNAGTLTVDAGADVTLAPGGIFTAITGRTITVNGAITAASGAINLTTVESTTSPGTPIKGSFDVLVNGQLSTAGLWTNDYGATGASIVGPAYIGGGSINISAAPDVETASVATVAATKAGSAPLTSTDISGSILIDGPNSLLNVSAGAYASPSGVLNLTAKGGNVSLVDATTYFPLALGETPSEGSSVNYGQGYISGFRVNGIGGKSFGNTLTQVAQNPSAITSQVAIGDGAIEGYGFSSGGTFSLTTPYINFADGIAAAGTNLPLSFFSKAGFGTYNITSYATALVPNTFTNGFGGYNAFLSTQVLTVQSGQTLNLTQTGYSPHLTGDQVAALRNLASGDQLSSVVAPSIASDDYDRNPINLHLGGLVEFEVAQGGQVVGAAGAGLSAAQIYNMGAITLPGGTLSQTETLPQLYVPSAKASGTFVLGAAVVDGASLSKIFSVNSDGTINENAISAVNPNLTNAQVATTDAVYLTGDLPAGVGIDLAAGSTTNLAGETLINPYATGVTQGRQVVTGTIVAGGTLQTAQTNYTVSTPLWSFSSFDSNVSNFDLVVAQPGLALVAKPGSTINLSGASSTFDQLNADGTYSSRLQWSNGGNLIIGAGGAITGAVIDAAGGAAQAAGGVLNVQSIGLSAVDPTTPTANVISAEQIQAAGFGELIVQGDLTTSGTAPVNLTLGQAFYLEQTPENTLVAAQSATTGTLGTAPTVSVAGTLQINAPYIALDGAGQIGGTGTEMAKGAGTVTFDAQALDVTGAVVFDQTVANVTLHALGDLRFIGVEPAQIGSAAVTPSLVGQLAVNGDLNLVAGQVYATTGSTYYVTSTASKGTITISSASTVTPATPYSAGSNLTIQAANVVQDGDLQAPLGALTLGSNTPLSLTQSSSNASATGSAATYAPATTSLTLGSGSITSVSAGGLSIPYGTTTDQTEYYFNPTNTNPLTAPPAGVLTLAGKTVTTTAGATVNLGGGGDVYAYEFVPGTGGTRDVLSQLNADIYTSNNGYQFPGGTQVYAIVPGLSSAAVAAYDPIYSANYGALYSSSQVGQRVYLNGGGGVAAGWYTLLPAQYATLPGGMEVVEASTTGAVALGASTTLNDGTVVVTGEFGGLGGTVQSTVHQFDIKSQTVIAEYSDIAKTSANTYFANYAAANGLTTPRLPIDAARLILSPAVLNLAGTFNTTPAAGGRGGEVDITGAIIDIGSTTGAPVAGHVELAAGQLDLLNADSLLIGGTRTDNSDGTTTLNVTATQINLANSAAAPLTAPDILLAVDGSASAITLKDGATIIASGADTTGQTGNYIINGATTGETGQGALVRVSDGVQRLVTRENQSTTAKTGVLTIGAATLTGTSLSLDSSGNSTLSPQASLSATNIALDASNITFAPSATGVSGLVITPAIQASFGAANLTLRTPGVIAFTNGAYSFGSLSLDTPGVSVLGGTGAVSLTASGAVKVQDSAGDAGACTTAGALACGAGTLSLAAQTLTFGDGTFRTYGAGQGVTLSAPGGVLFQGQGALNVGAAPLTIQTAYLGDAANATKVGVAAEIPSLAITTTGALTVANPTGAATPTVAGVPGASLTLTGQSIAVTGVDVRATAGSLTLASANGITVGPGSKLETPGYSQSFGDAADPYSETAPGGLLTLTTTSGDISLANGSTLSVGGGVGQAGSLTLDAAQGTVSFGGTISALAPTLGGGFTLNEAGAFDLNGFETATGGAFTGNVVVETGAGNLTLNNGLTLTAANVSLTADAGLVDIAGKINVSGVNGGNVSLYGMGGVTLEGTAQVLARASGYGADNATQASGGDVAIGTAGAGAITVASGALIDVGVANTMARAIETEQNGVINYEYAPADQGGAVLFRAPVSGGDNAESVNVNFAGKINGASSIVLEGFKAYDLAAVAASGKYSGVVVVGGTATLSTTSSTGNLPNFLASNSPGTLVDFIQNFNISSSYGKLSGLASQANFHAQPGVELDYSGAITLATNWNLGSGTVNVAGAVAAGLMVADPGIPGAYAVVPGDEAAVFSNYTTLTYRVGGSVLGEPGVLSIKAGGQLNIGTSSSTGSITDGFFTFGDQTDPAYLSNVLGAGVVDNAVLTPTGGATLALNFSQASLSSVAAGSSVAAMIPYDAAANTPGALGSGVNDAGDPIGSAEIFPLVTTAMGQQKAVSSWSYQLTGGANVASANPLAINTSAKGGVTVQGTGTYTYGGKINQTYSNTLEFKVGSADVSAANWLSAELAANPLLKPSSSITITLSAAPAAAAAVLEATAASYFAQYPGQYTFAGTNKAAPTGVTTSLTLASGYIQRVAAEWAALKTDYTAPSTTTAPATATTATLIRTGTGSISLAAAGDLNLQNGVTPTYVSTADGAANAATGYQVGGVAIYTAGQTVIPMTVTAIDTITGAPVTLNPSADETTVDNVGVYGYGYGVITPQTIGTSAKGLIGVLVSNPVYTDNGGNVTLSAGGDILGRRDSATAARIAGGANDPTFVGSAAAPWLVGSVGMDTNILVNPQLFTSGVGTLGGGNITVTAGRDVSDLTLVADTTVTTAAASGPGVAAGSAPLGLLTYGGGNVTVAAGGDLLGGRVDVGSGVASLSVGGSVSADGQTGIYVSSGSPLVSVPDSLSLELTNASIYLSAHGEVEIAGVTNIGAGGSDALGFYSATSGVSILANGTVSLDNTANTRLVYTGVDTDNISTAILPGSLQAVSLQGDVNLAGGASSVLLTPSAVGTLTVAAGADVTAVNLAMMDNDPGLSPGLFSKYASSVSGINPGSVGFLFPAVLPTTTTAQLDQLHDSGILHRNDLVPNRIYARGDIDNVVLSVPKQTRIGAGQDIVNMMFFGQNINPTDVTRIVAGRDITATTALEQATSYADTKTGMPTGNPIVAPTAEPTLQGDTFIIGGPGSFWLEAGRNLGPFLTSVTTTQVTGTDLTSAITANTETFGGGVISVGNSWDPYLSSTGASLYVEFGVSKGQDFDALLNHYLNPANFASMPDYLFIESLNANNVYVPDKSQPIYASQLIAYMQANYASDLMATYGATNVSYDQAYAAFAALPQLQQRPFLLQVYYSELSLTAVPGPTFDNYTRGYTAVNLLFPASLGYTANNLGGGTNGANAAVVTGNLDLRLATIQTQYGGDIDILGPGGEVLAGSTVATAQQAARRDSESLLLYNGNNVAGNNIYIQTPVTSISGIPASYEGILTLRGGNIFTFTDGSFILNQSRLFTEEEGNIIMWSSNADLNAGEGPKTSSDYPPVQVLIDSNAYSQLNASSDVTGAGIGAFQPDPNLPDDNVYLIAPRGTVDAGAAGIRVTGNIFVAALHVANADNFQVSGTAIGLPPTSSVVNVSPQATNASAASTLAAQLVAAFNRTQSDDRSIITVEVLGFGDQNCGNGKRTDCPAGPDGTK